MPYICTNKNKEKHIKATLFRINMNNIDITYIRKEGKHQVFLEGNLVGYIEKWELIGWVFYQFPHKNSEWFGGLETLKETKEWLSEYNGNDYIINKIINNK